MQIELKYTLSRAVRLKIMTIKSFSFKNGFDQFFSFAIYLCFFRALLDVPAFSALDNRWCPCIRISCSPHGACYRFQFFQSGFQAGAMMFLVSYITIVG